MTPPQNSLDFIIKSLIQAEKSWKKSDPENKGFERNMCKVLREYLLLELKYEDIVLQSRKPLYHYFKYSYPDFISREYMAWLYNPCNPVRFAIETFDSIQEIREELLKRRL